MLKIFTVTGMSCNNCARHVTQAVESVGGEVTSINYGSGKTVIETNGVDNRTLVDAIFEAGYDVINIEVDN